MEPVYKEGEMKEANVDRWELPQIDAKHFRKDIDTLDLKSLINEEDRGFFFE